ncbi:MAG: hypothetical protein SVU88_04055 [Candidatus Nanohaloarchaea archaeon]|nr:hypothetical protein [Candidatus Nanohaloarchaea archaeon]
MRFYIAGRFHRRDEVAAMMDRVRDHGHTITEDWTAHESLDSYADRPDRSAAYAAADIAAVEECDVFVLLANEDGRGAHAELGAALTSDTDAVYIIGDLREDAMFYFHPDVERREDIDAVLDEVDDR